MRCLSVSPPPSARNPQTLGGGETDKHLIYEGLARVSADAVLAGSSTVRGGRGLFRVASRACPIAPDPRPAASSDPDCRHAPRCPHRSRAALQHSRARRRPPDRARWHRRNARGARRASLDHAHRRRHRPHTHRRVRTVASNGRTANFRRRRTGSCRRTNRRWSRAGPLSHDVAGRRRRARHADVLASARTADGRAEARHLHEAGVVFEHSVLLSI